MLYILYSLGAPTRAPREYIRASYSLIRYERDRDVFLGDETVGAYLRLSEPPELDEAAAVL
jgi:hypothetical protein